MPNKNKSGSNSRQAGAPDRKILLDLNHLDEAEEDIINHCKNEKTKRNGKKTPLADWSLNFSIDSRFLTFVQTW